ncbi:MAG: hypothetical protein ACLFWF_02260 [Alphaproteobacteria bacterium]
MFQPLRTMLLLAALPLLSFQAAAELPRTSEEFPPVVCDTDKFMRIIECEGSYCDNVGLGCQRAGSARWGKETKFTWWISEEQGRKGCGTSSDGTPGAIAGFACNGGYCDRLSLFCAEVAGARLTDCRSFGRTVSEEGGGRLDLGPNRVAVAMNCSGSNCDNKSFRVCKVKSRTRARERRDHREESPSPEEGTRFRRRHRR